MSATARIPLLDALRGGALIAMIGYHLTWDLAHFGLIPPGTATTPLGQAIAATIAGTFLALAGVSFALAHADGIRWRPWALRLARLTLAALAVTAVTLWATPDQAIRFGILHMIAVAALLALPCLTLAWPVTLLAALAVLAVDSLTTGPAANAAAIWLGMGGPAPPASDFRPVVPWLAPVLLGLAAGQWLTRTRGIQARLAAVGLTGRTGGTLRWLGRHSLAVYLVHQPILFGALWGGLWLAR